MRFSAIKGQTESKKALVQAVQNGHVAHALLFAGREGNAQLALAIAFATYLNCENKGETDSCGECNSCQKFDKLVHPDLHFIFPTSTTKEVSKSEDAVSLRFLKEWRAFLTENSYRGPREWSDKMGGEGKQLIIRREESRNIVKAISMKAFEAENKIMLIWLPELMHVNTSNAILKILEEPPGQTVFMLVTNQADSLLPTILSRTQMIQVKEFSEEQLAEHLTEAGIETEKARQAAFMAEGNLNEAFRLAAEVHTETFAMFRDWMRTCVAANVSEMLSTSERFGEMSKEAQKSLLQYGLSIVREALLQRYASESELVRSAGERAEFVLKFAQFIPLNMAETLAGKFNDAYYHIERNANARMLFTALTIQLIKAFRQLRQPSGVA